MEYIFDLNEEDLNRINIDSNQEEPEQETISIFDNENIDDILSNVNNSGVSPESNQNESTISTTEDVIERIDEITNSSNEILQTIESTIEDIAENNDDNNDDNDDDDNENNNDDEVVNYINNIENGFHKTNSSNKENEARFSGAEWFEKVKETNITIAGVGGIGSHFSFLLSRLQPNNISLFDNDTVDFSNLAGQLYSLDNVGQYKCSAMSNIIQSFSNYNKVSIFNELYTGQKVDDIMICGFDNMSARRIFFSNWYSYVNRINDIERKKRCLFIDGRLGLEELQIYAIRGDEDANKTRYLSEYMFDDSEAEQVPCSMKQTSFMASMIASLMVNVFVNAVTNFGEPMDIRPVPFLTMYRANDMKMDLIF